MRFLSIFENKFDIHITTVVYLILLVCQMLISIGCKTEGGVQFLPWQIF